MRIPIFLTVALCSFVLSSCDTLECGIGTVRENGECVAGEDTPIDCGPGFTWEQSSGLCRPAFDATWGICGPNTELGVNDAGVPVCIGTGTLSCNDKPPCPQPSLSGRASVCGRIYDMENFLPIVDHQELLHVGSYDVEAFVADPGGTNPQQTVKPDKCGYFKIKDVTITLGLVAVGINDKDELVAGSADVGDFRLTGVAPSASAGGAVEVAAFVVRRTTDDDWTASAGEAISLATQGVYMPIYINTNGTKPTLSGAALLIDPEAVYPFDGAPTAGVVILPTDSANDFYFTDTDPTTLTTPTPGGAGDAGVTGPNGFGLLRNSGARPHSGSGPVGCTWPSSLAAAVSGLVFVHLREGTCI